MKASGQCPKISGVFEFRIILAEYAPSIDSRCSLRACLRNIWLARDKFSWSRERNVAGALFYSRVDDDATWSDIESYPLLFSAACSLLVRAIYLRLLRLVHLNPNSRFGMKNRLCMSASMYIDRFELDQAQNESMRGRIEKGVCRKRNGISLWRSRDI